MSALSLNSNASWQHASSASSLTPLDKKESHSSGGALAVIKEGTAMVKEEGIFSSLMFSKKYLILRERQLDFHKASNSTKLSFSVVLKDVHSVTRSDQGTAFEIVRSANPASPGAARDGPTKTVICKVDSDDDVYSWIDNIYERCPSMGGVSNPTNFAHQVHVGFDPKSGAFIGLPPEWEKLLMNSAISKEDYQKNPDAVIEALNFYTEKMVKHNDDPGSYANMAPMPQASDYAQKQLGLGRSSGGTGITPPRPQYPGRQNTYENTPPRALSPNGGLRSPSDGSTTSPAGDQLSRAEAERRRRAEDDARRDRQARDQRERDRYREDERRRREREEQAAYNASLPQTRQPMAKQEVGGGYGGARDGEHYNPNRDAPQAPGARSGPQSQSTSLRQPQAPRNGPSPDGRSREQTTPPKPFANQPRPQSPGPGSKSNQTNGQAPAASTRIPVKPSQQQGVQRSEQAGAAGAPKPLNVTVKQPTGAAAVAEAAKVLEGGGSAPAKETRRDVRMSAMSESEVMIRLREVVSKEPPLVSYNKQKKIGQGASGSVYVARIREGAISELAKKTVREQGPRAQVAIKQMDLRNQPRKELIVNEIVVMKDSKHPNIVNFIEAFLPEDAMELWVVMEFMEGGPLTDVIDNNPSIAEDQIATISLEVRHSFEKRRLKLTSMCTDMQGSPPSPSTKHHPQRYQI